MHLLAGKDVSSSAEPAKCGQASADIDPLSGRGRLPYATAAALCTGASGDATLHQRAQELEAGGDDDVPLEFLLQLRDLHVALEHRRVVPGGMFEGRDSSVTLSLMTTFPILVPLIRVGSSHRGRRGG